MNSKLGQNLLIGTLAALYVYFVPELPLRFNVAVFFGIIVVILLQLYNPNLIPLRAGYWQIIAAVVFLGGSWRAGVSSNSSSSSVWYENAIGPVPVSNVAVVIALLTSACMCFLFHLSLMKNENTIDSKNELNRQRTENDNRKIENTAQIEKNRNESIANLLDQNHTQIINEINNHTNARYSVGVSSNVVWEEDDRKIKASLETRLEFNQKASREFSENAVEIGNEIESNTPVISFEFAKTLIKTNFHLAITILEEVSKLNREIDIRTELVLSDLYLTAKRFEDSKRANNRALEVDPKNSFAISRSVYFSYANGDYTDAEKLSIEVIESKKRRSEEVALDYHNLATLLANIQRPDDALEYVQKAYEAIEDGDASTSIASVMLVEAAAVHNKGLSNNNVWYSAESQRLYFRSHNILESQSDDLPLLARSKCEIARFYLEQYLHDNANKNHVNRSLFALSAINHGSLCLSEQYLLESINILKNSISNNGFLIESSLELLLEIYQHQDCIPKLLVILSEYELEFRLSENVKELILEDRIRMIGRLYIKVDRFDLAEPLLIESIKLLETSRISDKRIYCSALSNLGSYYRDIRKDYDTAEKYIRLALEQRKMSQGVMHLDTALTRKNLAYCLRLKGQEYYEEARILYRKALNILIDEVGHEDQKVAKWIGDFAMLNSDEGYFGLARIKLNYAYDMHVRLGSITMVHIPISLMPVNSSTESISFPPIPTGPIHEHLARLINVNESRENWVKAGIDLFKHCTLYNPLEISELMNIPISMVDETFSTMLTIDQSD